ncbi:MAG: hypothetical protein ABMA26_04310 [Limisphaerales bacterium]
MISMPLRKLDWAALNPVLRYVLPMSTRARVRVLAVLGSYAVVAYLFPSYVPFEVRGVNGLYLIGRLLFVLAEDLFQDAARLLPWKRAQLNRTPLPVYCSPTGAWKFLRYVLPATSAGQGVVLNLGLMMGLTVEPKEWYVAALVYLGARILFVCVADVALGLRHLATGGRQSVWWASPVIGLVGAFAIFTGIRQQVTKDLEAVPPAHTLKQRVVLPPPLPMPNSEALRALTNNPILPPKMGLGTRKGDVESKER